jgi:hypothetical protein
MVIAHTMPRRRYPSSGACIYCGNIFLRHQLTEEHIIPLALSGDWTIDAAACSSCQKRSNETYEGEALQSDLIRVPRAILELKRRRAKKKGPLPLPPIFPYGTAGLTSVEGLERRHFDLTEFPPVFAMLVIEPAGILGAAYRPGSRPERNKLRIWIRFIEKGKPTGSIVSDETTYQHFDVRQPSMISLDYTLANGQRGSLRQALNVNAFGLMLAKIAYCFGVAELSRDGFHGTEIRQLLDGDRDDIFNFVGGSLNGEKLTSRHLHYLAFRERNNMLTVIVHLFSSYETPAYEVVIGRRK